MHDAEGSMLVSGATGRQGGAVVRHLLARGWKPRALSRNPGGAAAQDLVRLGVEGGQGDLEDPASLERAGRGGHGGFCVQGLWSFVARRGVAEGTYPSCTAGGV